MQQNWQELDPSPGYIRCTARIEAKGKEGKEVGARKRGGGGRGAWREERNNKNGRKRGVSGVRQVYEVHIFHSTSTNVAEG